MTAQLVEVAGGAILWTQKFDRPLAELTVMQEDLIVEVAAHLGTQLFRAGMENALKRPDGLTAWERVTRALASFRLSTQESLPKAMEEASKAVEIAPHYGLAHAVLASTTAMWYCAFIPDDPQEVDRIGHHIDHAMARDDDDAAVLGHVAYALCLVGQPREALQRAKRAIAINPGYGFSYLPAGVASLLLDQAETALGYFSDFRRFEPNSPYEHYSYAWDVSAHLQIGDWAAAMRANAASLELNLEAGYTHCYTAMIAQHLGQTDQARQSLLESRRREPAATLALWELRLKRWTAEGPIRQELLSLIRTLWAESEDNA